MEGAGEQGGRDAARTRGEGGSLGARPSPHWILFACAGLSIVAMLALALFVEPDERGFGTHEQLGMLPCRSMDWFGVPCPGCGVTTSVALAVQGRPLDSIANQPFGFLTALFLPVFFLWSLRVHFSGGDLYAALASRRARPLLVGGLAALVAAWIYKIWLVF
ncbi:MAG: DUF2752 domain-containing protein [Planctomycetota bacterium]|nr:DUF2752 domain-containing protein [Planctomycetota bacterium]